MRATSSGDRVLLSDVKILTFRRGQKTTHRRVDAVQQLICDDSGSVGCPKKKEYLFEDATCINEGIGDNMMPRWSCTASSLPQDTELGSVNVSCEGYTYRDDPYVLEGSCAMEYTLTAPTPQGPFAAFLIAFMGFFAFCVCCNKRKPVGAVETKVRPPRAGAPPAYHAASAPSSSSSLPLAHAVDVDDLEKNASPSFGKPGAGVATAHPVGTAADAAGPAESDGKHSSLGKVAAAGAAATGAAAAGLAALASRNKHKKQQPLPKGWEEKVDPASGGTYYLNHDTRETTWDDPREAGEHQHLLAGKNSAAQENKWWNPLSMGNRLRPGVPFQAGRSAWQDYGHVPEQGEPSTFQGATTSGRGDGGGGGGGGGGGHTSTTQGGTTGRGDGHASTAHGSTSGRDSGSGGWGGLFGGGGGGGSGHSSTAQGRTTGRGSSGGWGGGGGGGGGGGTFGGTSGR